MSLKEQRIGIDQVKVGLYIHLDTWMDHPFLFNSFKIRSEKQIQVLRSLGLKDVLYVAAKSDGAPLPPSQATKPTTPPESEIDPEIQAMWQEKEKRRKIISKQREAYCRCERQFVATVSSVKGMLRNLFARPQETVEQAQTLIGNLVDSLLAEKDVLIHLMNVKNTEEGTYYHSLNVTMLSLMLARQAGLKQAEMCELGLGGKEKIPTQILLKKTPWNAAETNFYKQHVAYGLELSEKLPDLPQGAIDIIAQHHEMLDGSGYPAGLAGDRIGKLARIVAIANAFDNACNRINPADSLTPAHALSVMFKKERNKYDAELLQHFVRCLGVYPPGSIVLLSNEAIALVVSVNPGNLLCPSLLLYDPTVPKEEALLFNLADEPDLSVVKTLKPGQLPKPVFDYLNPRIRISYFSESNKRPPSSGN